MVEEDLRDLLAAAAVGDENAFMRLCEQYAPLIRSMSARFAVSFSALPENLAIGTQDLEQEARLALFRAAQSFDSAQEDVQFGLYAKICIRNSFVSLLRKQRSRRFTEKRSVHESSSSREADPLLLAVENDVSHRLSDRISQALSSYENSILEQYVSGMSVKNISLSVGKSEKSVHNALYRIRVKIKGLLEN